MRSIQSLSALAVALACLAGCGGSGSGSTGPSNNPSNNQPNNPPSGGTSLTVSNNKFTPTALSVTAGQTVTWTWDSCSNDPYGGGATCVSHSIVFDDGPASELQSSGSYSRTFASKGSFPYHCSVHGSTMAGSITVQ